MAIAFRGVSAALVNPATAAAITPAVNASAAAGDLSVMVLAGKPFSTSGMAFTGWVPLTGILASGAVANSGSDLGSVFIAVWVKESAPTGAVTAPTMTGFNTAQAAIATFSKAATEVWDYSVFTTGIDSSVGTGYSATGGAIPTASGDMIVALSGFSTDGAASSPLLGGMAGSTIGAQTTDRSVVSSTGNQTGLVALHAAITAGSSGSAPTFTATLGTAGEGETVFVRLRVTPLAVAQPIWQGQAIPRASIW